MISDMINVPFYEAGLNQTILLELWIYTDNGWEYYPNYILKQNLSIV
ncbi:MAG: hypothetical protein ACTSRX_08415 [Promethearchaeota archaeon]